MEREQNISKELITEMEKEILIINTELDDQKDYLNAIIGKVEEIYKNKNESVLQIGFQIGEIYRMLLTFKSDSQKLSIEILKSLNDNLKNSSTN